MWALPKLLLNTSFKQCNLWQTTNKTHSWLHYNGHSTISTSTTTSSLCLDPYLDLWFWESWTFQTPPWCLHWSHVHLWSMFWGSSPYYSILWRLQKTLWFGACNLTSPKFWYLLWPHKLVPFFLTNLISDWNKQSENLTQYNLIR